MTCSTACPGHYDVITEFGRLVGGRVNARLKARGEIVVDDKTWDRKTDVDVTNVEFGVYVGIKQSHLTHVQDRLKADLAVGKFLAKQSAKLGRPVTMGNYNGDRRDLRQARVLGRLVMSHDEIAAAEFAAYAQVKQDHIRYLRRRLRADREVEQYLAHQSARLGRPRDDGRVREEDRTDLREVGVPQATDLASVAGRFGF